jgi:hypothetical protein
MRVEGALSGVDWPLDVRGKLDDWPRVLIAVGGSRTWIFPAFLRLEPSRRATREKYSKLLRNSQLR